MNIAEAVTAAASRLTAVESPRREAELLLCHVLDRPRSHLLAWPEQPLAPDALSRFDALVDRRAAGEPVAYLFGARGFWRFDLKVTPATLIPRPETELLVGSALALIPPDAEWALADLGTGSGAIALALAHERPRCAVMASDASRAALTVARENAAALGLNDIEFVEGDWYGPLGARRFHLIASNPPYIADTDPHLGRGDLRFEPRGALASGADGLDAIRTLATGACDHLHPGGWLLVEHGFDQGGAVRSIFLAAGLTEVEVSEDLEGRDRVTRGRRPG